jgi:type II secretory pathway pseudopilin PulG
MVELLISVLVIGILMALLITGALYARRSARAVADGQAIRNVAQAVVAFKQEFGFIPPLIRDEDPGAGSNPIILPGNATQPARLHVYTPLATQADADALRASLVPYSSSNPLADSRFSEVSLAAYLAGVIPTDRGGGAPAGVPIDGVPGPGFYKPKRDGSFAIPPDVLNPNPNAADASARKGGKYEPLVNLSKSGVQFGHDPGDPPEEIVLQDSRGVPIRYYTWIRGAANGTIATYADLNIPLMVGRWNGAAGGRDPDPRWDATLAAFYGLTPPSRDIGQNAALRNATWAVVGAGPDGLFGDESAAELAKYYGNKVLGSPGEELKARLAAEKDNLVEVGP